MIDSALWAGKVKLDSAHVLHVKLGSCGLSDEQMLALAHFTEELLKPAEGSIVRADVDLSRNHIGDLGLSTLINVFQEHHVQMKCLKLFRNQIGDDGGLRLAELIKQQKEPLEELHLSHNRLMGLTMVRLCLAIGYHSSQAYPYVGRSESYVPCWVRLEQNIIADPQGCLELLKREAQVRICLAENRGDCGPWRCNYMDKTTKGVPSVHLFSIHSQDRKSCGPPGPQESDAALQEVIRNARGANPAVRTSAMRADRRALRTSLAQKRAACSVPRPGGDGRGGHPPTGQMAGHGFPGPLSFPGTRSSTAPPIEGLGLDPTGPRSPYAVYAARTNSAASFGVYGGELGFPGQMGGGREMPFSGYPGLPGMPYGSFREAPNDGEDVGGGVPFDPTDLTFGGHPGMPGMPYGGFGEATNNGEGVGGGVPFDPTGPTFAGYPGMLGMQYGGFGEAPYEGEGAGGGVLFDPSDAKSAIEMAQRRAQTRDWSAIFEAQQSAQQKFVKDLITRHFGHTQPQTHDRSAIFQAQQDAQQKFVKDLIARIQGSWVDASENGTTYVVEGSICSVANDNWGCVFRNTLSVSGTGVCWDEKLFGPRRVLHYLDLNQFYSSDGNRLEWTPSSGNQNPVVWIRVPPVEEQPEGAIVTIEPEHGDNDATVAVAQAATAETVSEAAVAEKVAEAAISETPPGTPL